MTDYVLCIDDRPNMFGATVYLTKGKVYAVRDRHYHLANTSDRYISVVSDNGIHYAQDVARFVPFTPSPALASIQL